MAQQGIELLSPLGRLVQGSLWELQDQYEDDEKTVKKNDDGTNVRRAYFAIAVDKNSPEWLPFWQQLVAVAASGYPQYFNNGNVPGLRDFAWKVTDGDGFDKYGKPNSEKPGFKGCWIIKFSSSFLPRCYEKGKYAKHEQLQDARSIKLGYFIRAGVIVRPNIGSKTHGLYLNSDMVSLEFVGEEIQFGRDASAAFAAAQPSGYVPAGAMQLPAGGMGGGAIAGQMPGNPMMSPGGGNGAGMSPGNGMPGQMPQGGAPMGGMPGGAAMPGTNVMPQNGFAAGALNGGQMPGGMPQGGTPMGGMPGNVQQSPMPGATQFPFNQQPRQLVPTAKAGGYTLEQFYQNGFDEARVIQEGYFQYA